MKVHKRYPELKGFRPYHIVIVVEDEKDEQEVFEAVTADYTKALRPDQYRIAALFQRIRLQLPSILSSVSKVSKR